MGHDAHAAHRKGEKMSDQVLLKAAELIEERGWCQFTSEDAEGHICLRQAINIAAMPGFYACDAVFRLGRFLGTNLIAAQFNDTPGRTKEEVIAALRAAAEIA